MSRFPIERTKRAAPYVTAYALGAATFWAGWTMMAPPAPEALPVRQLVQDSVMAPPPTEMDLRTATADSDLVEQLAEAARGGDKERVTALIDGDVPVDARDDRGRTALILAAIAIAFYLGFILLQAVRT